MKRFQRIAQVVAHLNSLPSGADRWGWSVDHLANLQHKVGDQLAKLLEYAPSGSGFDSGTCIEEESSGCDKLVFTTSYHHMNDAGMYDGWTDHKIIVKPCLAHGYTLRVTGSNRNGVRQYIGDIFAEWLDGVAEDVPLNINAE